MTKQISHAARALAIGMVAALVLAGTAMGAVQLSNSGGGSWQYYKEITISNSGGALSDYQVLVSLTSSNFPTNAQTSGADIRFTDESGIELSYWIESWDYAGRSAKVWVKVPGVTAGASTMRMWYGNPSAGSASNGDTTFEFFDDFKDGTIDTTKWVTQVSAGSITETGGYLEIVRVDGNPNSIQSVTGIALTNYIVESRENLVSIGSSKHLNLGIVDANQLEGTGFWPFFTSGGVFNLYKRASGSWILLQGQVGSYSSGSWSEYRIMKLGTDFSFFKDGSQVGNTQTVSVGATTYLIAPRVWNDGYGEVGTIRLDNIRVRRYASPEPSVSVGTEQSVIKEPSTVATTVPSVSRTGLVAEYHFDGDAKDSSGNNGALSFVGNPTWVSGRVGNALNFDGINDGLTNDIPNGELNGFSGVAWIYPKEFPEDKMVFSWGRLQGAWNYYFTVNANRIRCAYRTPSNQARYIDGYVSVPINTWSFVACTYDGSIGRVYLNTLEVGKLSSTDTVGSTTQFGPQFGFNVGYQRSDTGGGDYFDGIIDEVRIYNRALSAEEIKANYASIIGKSPATTATKPASAPTSSPATPAPTIAQTTIPTPAPTAAPESSNYYVYAGIGGIILLLVAIVALKRRSSSKVEKPLKREPTVKPEPQKPAPLAEPPKFKPAPVTVPEAPGVYVKTAFGYKGAAIIYKLKVENNTSDPISDIKVYPYVPDVFLLKEKEKSIALIEPKASQTVTFEIRPTGECGDCNVSGRVNYYDMASRKRQDIELEPKSLSIVCPMLHGKEISEAEWHDTVSNLVKTEESTREIDMPAESLFTMVSRIIKDMHMHMQKPEVTQNHKLFNGVACFYGEGVKGLKYAAQVEVVGGAKKSKLILKAWAEKEEALTGFYHGILDEIEKRVNVKEYIDDSIVQYNVHIGDKIGTLIKDSVVQRSTIGASARKCPDCGREVEANEKFCLECGAKLGG